MELGITTFAETYSDPKTGETISHGERLRQVIAEIELAEQVGLAVYGVGEHHRPDFASSAPAVVLAAAAARTSSIRLFPAVSILSTDDPVRVFQEYATVDLISEGRVELLVGRGSFIESFPLFGYDLADYDEIFAEKLDLLLEIRDNVKVTWSGRFRPPIQGQGIYPRPHQDPLPIWVAVGGTPQSIVRAASRGLPVALAIIGGSPERFGSVYNTTALTGSISDQQNGHGTAEFPISGIQNGGPDGIALVDPDGAVLQFLSYEGAFTAGDGPAVGRISRDIGVSESSTTLTGQSLQLTGADNQSFTWTGPATSSFGSPNAGQNFGGDCPTPEEAPDPTPTDVTIPEIQGATHFSDYDGMLVRTSGVVTATDSNGARGFYLQDPVGDGDDPAGRATSDAIFVFTGAAPGVAVGDQVTVEGTVSEFIPGGAFTRNLPTTQIGADSVEVESSDNPLPPPVVIGEGGRLPPTEVIEDDNFGSFDPTTDGLDFLEAVEAMLVTVKAPTTVGGTSFFGEMFATPAGVTPTQMSQRGTLNISPDDFNPERIQIDPDTGVFDIDPPFVDTGAVLSDVTGVVGYAFGNFEVIPTQGFNVVSESTLVPETTALRAFGTTMTVASYNVLNLDPNDHEADEDERDTDIADGRFEAVAFDIVHNLGSPDIVALQEIQDNSGADNDGVTSADETLQLLVDEIAALGGPAYAFIDNPFIGNNTSGGQPGANIRVAYLYNPHRVTPVGEPETVVDPTDQQVNPANPFWDTRLPLVQTFDFKNRHVIVVNNHFASKSGSAPLYGTAQNSTERQEDPTVNGSLDQRQEQAQAVHDYLEPALADGANAVVLGDFNEFEFISPLDPILTQNLVNLTLQLGADERYSYVFEGNSQSLDHILVSEGLNPWATFDAVHVNAEFAGTSSSASDHDPLIASIDLAQVAPVQSRRPMTPPGSGGLAGR